MSTNLAGDTERKISDAGKNIWFPAVSPDNQLIAFWSTTSGFNELWVYNFQQRSSQQITFFNEKFTQANLQNFNVHNAPAWMPDSKNIFFSHLGKIWKIDAAGFNLETITPLGVHYSPSVSPDGKFIVYIKEIGQNRNLFVRQLATNDEWPLTKFPSTHLVGSPAWSQNGKQIAFTLSILDKVDIWVIQTDGSNLTQLTKDGFSNSPAWSLDGTKIAFSSGRQNSFHWEIWAMNQDGSSQFSITRNGGFSPVWIRQTRDKFSFTSPVPIPSVIPTKVVSIASIPLATATAHISKLSTPVIQKSVPTAKQPTPVATEKPIVTTAKKAPTAQATKQIAVKATPAAEKIAKTEQEKAEAEFAAAEAESKNAKQGKNQAEEEYEEYEEYADADQAVLPENALGSKKGKNKIVFTPEIQFYFAKDLIKPESLATLKQLAEKMNEYPDAILVIQGYMRGPGFFKKALPILRTLSRARANSVLRHLIVNEKIRQINVNALGEGDTSPDLIESEEKLILLVEVR